MMVYMATAFSEITCWSAWLPGWAYCALLPLPVCRRRSLQSLLYFSIGVYSFTVIRMLQTGMIAAVIPLVISGFAGEGGDGTTLGFLNSGRFVGNALGPIMATTILAQFGLLTLYLTIAGLTLVMLVTFLASLRT
jgi:hypothetical protein